MPHKKRNAFTERVVALIRHIPPGCVATYGQIARLAGAPRHARQVGRILHSLSARENLPWHRVINSRGQISLPAGGRAVQRALLEQEGVRFSAQGVVDLGEFGWRLEA